MTNISLMKQDAYAVFLISISAFLVYSNSLNGIWAFDDILINYGTSIDQIINISKTRIISYLTFLINQKINAYDQFNFRILNLLIHIVNSNLVYLISFITIKNYDNIQKDNQIPFYIALISALLFAVHPLNINAVSYIIQRMASLATLFVLLSVLFYIYANNATEMTKKIGFYLISALSIISGILSKEIATLAIPLILLYDYIFISKFDKKYFLKKLLFICSIGIAALILASLFVPVIKSAAEIISLFQNINKPIQNRNWLAADVYWTPLQHILTEFRVISRYLLLFIFPLPKLLVFDYWNYPISKTMFEPVSTFVAILFVLSLIIFSVIKIKKYPFLSFGILWYFISISLESFIAVGLDLYFEHRNYMPLTGLCFGIIAQLILFSWKWLEFRYAKLLVFIVILIFFGGMTFQRNFVWNDKIVFWKDVLEKTGDNPRPLIALGNSSYTHGYFADAEKYYKEAVKICSDKKYSGYLLNVLYRLDFMYISLEKQEQAVKIKDLIGKLYKYPKEYYVLNGMLLNLNRDYNNAIENYNFALSSAFSPYELADKATILSLIGESYRGLGQYLKAYNYYQAAVNISPSLSAAYHGIAKLEIAQRKFDSAKDNLNKALMFDPYNFMVLTDMAYLMLIQGNKFQDALPYARKAIEANPPLYQPYLIMGIIKLASGNEREAQMVFAKAKELKARDYQILFNMAWGYSINRNTEKQNYCLKELLKLKDVPDNIKNIAIKLLSQSH